MAAPKNQTIGALIAALQKHDPATSVEYVVCKTDGELVAIDVAKQAKPLIKMLKLFGSA